MTKAIFLFIQTSDISMIDLGIVLLLVFGFIRGFIRGFVKEVVALVGIVASLYVAIYLSPITESYLEKGVDFEEGTLHILAFALTFVALLIVIKLLGGILTKIIGFLALGLVNRFLGAIFGFLKWGILLSALLLLLTSAPVKNVFDNHKTLGASIFYEPMTSFGEFFFPMIKENISIDGLNLPFSEELENKKPESHPL